MPRKARQKSCSGFVHVIVRGIGKQILFEETSDYLFFLSILKKNAPENNIIICAYCMMDNHVHLLLFDEEQLLPVFMKKIGVSYAVYYNQKYQRIGHVFQDRYKSENVETDPYFMTVLRYILQNPMKAGLESRPGSYRWSSFQAYEKGKGAVTDIQYALDLFGNRETLMEYLVQSNDDTVMDEADFDRRLREEQALDKMRQITHCASVPAFQALPRPLQKEYAAQLYKDGLSLGQIARFTGMSKSTVFNAVNALKSGIEELETAVLHESGQPTYDATDQVVW